MKDNKLEQLKEEYDDMKIPDNLRSIVVDSIQKAKEDLKSETDRQTTVKESMDMTTTNNKKNNGNKVLFYTKRAAQVAAVFAVAITIAANSGATVAHAMEKIPVIGAIAKVVTFRNYEVKGENVEANIEVPQVGFETEEGTAAEELGTAAEQLNKSVEEYTNELIAKFEADIAEMGDEGHESVDTNYEVVTDTDTLFSLRLNTTIAVGGAQNISKIYHIDKRTNEVITLKDLFKEDADFVTAVSENIKTQMRERMNADEGVSYFIDSEEGYQDWDFKAVKEDQNFYIDENGKLHIVFDEYEVAPGYMGVVEFEIPTDVIQNIVKDGFVK